MKSWYLELIITEEMGKKIKAWERDNNGIGEDLVYELLDEYFKDNKK